MMPGMDGFEVCRRLKTNPVTAHIPVVIVTALDQPADRVRGLEHGADDFLTKPLDEMALIARVRSLTRLKLATDELRNRALTAALIGGKNPFASAIEETGLDGKILLVEDRASAAQRISEALSPHHSVTAEADPNEALFKAAEGNFDLAIISLGLKDFDGLRLCSQMRSLERTRTTPLLTIADLEDRQRVLRGLDLGVNDYLSRPIDRNELLARVRTQIKRKRFADALRQNLQASIEMAVIDPLTGLNNRRYLESHLASLIDQAAERQRPLSLMVLDIDHFKQVNDSHGHDAGDAVLKGFADRVKAAVRGVDLMCRLGGEEFVVVMPDTTLAFASRVAERIREAVESGPFEIGADGRSIPITVSIGLADRGEEVDADSLFRRADQALYRSKNAGRNRVSVAAAA
jgi:two-component system cell cycle response regulator